MYINFNLFLLKIHGTKTHIYKNYNNTLTKQKNAYT